MSSNTTSCRTSACSRTARPRAQTRRCRSLLRSRSTERARLVRGQGTAASRTDKGRLRYAWLRAGVRGVLGLLGTLQIRKVCSCPLATFQQESNSPQLSGPDGRAPRRKTHCTAVWRDGAETLHERRMLIYACIRAAVLLGFPHPSLVTTACSI
jgi:hypothetical protein